MHKIEAQYGKAQRIWVMDRGIPTEEVLAEMRQADPPVSYLVGTPKGRLTKLESAAQPALASGARGVEVKLLPQEQELYVLAQSRARIHKERAMRRRKLKWLGERLKQLRPWASSTRVAAQAGRGQGTLRAAWRLIDIAPKPAAPSATPEPAAWPVPTGLDSPHERPTSSASALNRKKLRQVRRREGRYLLRTNLCGRDPPSSGSSTSSSSRSRPRSRTSRTICSCARSTINSSTHRSAHLRRLHGLLPARHAAARLKPLAPGLTPRAVLDKLAGMQMLDVHFPTTDGRTLILSRYTELNADQKLLGTSTSTCRRNRPHASPPRPARPDADQAHCSGDLLTVARFLRLPAPSPLQLRKLG